jgi:4-oxalocrotonate tautomerase
MPFMHIRLASPRSIGPEQVRHLQTEATRLMASVMRKNAELTSVLVEVVPLQAWSIGARPTPAAAHLDVKVTQGTNSPEEKERFIAEATALLRDVIGDALPVATYVVVDDVPADAWGYGGLTQDARRRAALPRQAA